MLFLFKFTLKETGWQQLAWVKFEYRGGARRQGPDLRPGQILMVSGRLGALILELCGSIYIDMMVFSKLGWNLGMAGQY